MIQHPLDQQLSTRNSFFVPAVLLLFAGIINATLVLNLHNGFWFDDDATLFAFVSGIENGLFFFTKPAVISGGGFSFTPMQMLSYWVDYQLAGTDPTLAYCHNILAYLLSSVLLFIVLRFKQTVTFSFLLTISWMFLPSTTVILEFIGARHYMEGFLLTLLSILFYFKNKEHQNYYKRAGWALLSIVALFLAMLCKELFVTASTLLLFLLYLSGKRFPEAGGVVLAGILYTLYRVTFFGISTKYPIPRMDLGEYLLFLKKIPYIFSAGYLGYGLFIITIAAAFFLIVRKQISFKVLIVLMFFLIINLATIFPGSKYLSDQWLTHGAWYRLAFIINFNLLFFGFFILKDSPRFIQCFAMVVLGITITLGAVTTQNSWKQMKLRYEITGKFYLQNDDKIVYSRLPAYWYLYGLKDLFNTKHPFIIAFFPHKFDYSKASYATEIWHYKDGKMIPNQQKWVQLKQKYSPNKTTQ